MPFLVSRKLACQSLQSKSIAKIGTLNVQQKYMQKLAPWMCYKSTCKSWHVKCAKQVHAKIGTLKVQKKYAEKLTSWICKMSMRKNWHVKSLKRGSVKICSFSSMELKVAPKWHLWFCWYNVVWLARLRFTGSTAQCASYELHDPLSY